jgi:hypothetical protein
MAQMVVRGGRPGLYITDYEELIKELNRIQPTLVNDLRKEFRQIAKPVQNQVKTAIPNSPPTSGIHKKRKSNYQSGFYPKVVPGRVTWGANSQNKMTPARSVGVETIGPGKAKSRMRKNKMNQVAIARLRVDNAATVLADLAGSSGAWINKHEYTREYDYSRSATGQRIHRINNQGRAMIQALGGKGSRYVWPAANRAIPHTYQQTRMVLNKSFTKINRRLK